MLRRAAVLGLEGVTLGTLLALAASRGLEGLLLGVSPNDPWTAAAVAALPLAAVLGAGIGPSRRATAVDPVESIRTE